MLHAFMAPISIGFSHCGYNFLVSWYRRYQVNNYVNESDMAIMKYRYMLAEKKYEKAVANNINNNVVQANPQPISDAEVVNNPVDQFQTSWSNRVVM